MTAINTSRAQTSSSGTSVLEDGKTYEIWNTLHLILLNGTERDDIQVSAIVRSLPREAKIIIARYSKILETGWSEASSRDLARALGDFASLSEAQKALLKDWDDKSFMDSRNYPIYPSSLQIRKKGKSFFFKYNSTGGRDKLITDEFKIGPGGRIVCIPEPEPLKYIRYRWKDMSDKYDFYEIRLNGGKMEYFFSSIFLDPDNIKSVAVNERDEIVYITQKNKTPEYFVRADIAKHLEFMKAFKAKKLEEIALIRIRGKSMGDQSVEFTENDKIETSAITGFSSYVDEYGNKYITVNVK